MRLLLLFIVWSIISFAAGGEPTHSVAKGPEHTGSESLGGQLLNDLPPAIAPPAELQPGAKLDSRSIDHGPRQTPQRHDLGKDVGGFAGTLLLARVRNGMQRAESLLDFPSTAKYTNTIQQAGAVQKQVVAQLDELIAELSRQCQGGQAPPLDDLAPQPSQPNEAKPSAAKRAASPGPSPARDSSDSLDRANARPADENDVDELVKHLWGHLPERSREQVLQSFSDTFLPKYELEIEQYYRRLSEEPAQNRPR